MSTPVDWQAKAYNQVPESENRIHSDETAQRFGFTGGLVPGVTVSAYLMHPAVVAWGEDWLSRGSAKAVVSKPVYDGADLSVALADATASSYGATLSSGGQVCATGSAALPDRAPKPPVMRGDPRVPRGFKRQAVSREVLEKLATEGMFAVRSRWNAEAEITTYLRDAQQMPEALRPSAGGLANPAFVLGMTNWALAANVYLSAWLHLQTEHQNYAPIPQGSELVTELSVAELFERKGHQFVDLELTSFLVDGTAVMGARLRAIYKLRGSDNT